MRHENLDSRNVTVPEMGEDERGAAMSPILLGLAVMCWRVRDLFYWGSTPHFRAAWLVRVSAQMCPHGPDKARLSEPISLRSPHCHQVCGKPCKSKMVRAPCPVVTKCIRRPGSTSAIACETILACSLAAKLASSAS